MKKTFLRLIALLAAAAMLYSCSGGQGTADNTDAAKDTTPAATDGEAAVSTAPVETSAELSETAAETQPAEPLTFSLASAPFRVITSDETGTSDNLSTVMNALAVRLNAMSQLKYSVKSDTAVQDSDGAVEILIGKSSREAARSLYDSLGPLDYTVSVAGSKILLVGGCPDATAKAVYWFMVNCIMKNVTDYTEGVLYEYVSDQKMPDIPVLAESNYDILKGLTVYAMGDSYFGGASIGPSKVWPAYLAVKYSQTFVNYGKGGSTVSDYITTNNPMCQRISAMQDGNPDIVLFEGGANDWNKGIPLGTVGSKDTKTFCGAVASCIEQLHEKYPNALIVCISNWEYGEARSGVQSTDFAKAMCDVAALYSYTYSIYAADTSIIPAFMTSEVFRAKYCIATTDKNHLNEEGMQLVMPFFEKVIAEGYAAYLKK